MKRTNVIAVTILTSAILSVTACGGGGGSSPPPSPDSQTPPVVAPGTPTSTLDSRWNKLAYTPGVKKVVFTGSKYLAVGNKGHIAESADGSSWTEIDAATAMNFEDVATNGTSAVAVRSQDSSGGGFVVTTDGSSWTVYDTTSLAETECGAYLNSVTYDGGQFVGIFNRNLICTSADGANWQLQSTHDLNSLGLTLEKIVSGSGKYVITLSGGSVGEIMYMNSPTETTTNITVLPFAGGTQGSISNLIHGGSTFVGTAGDGQITYSSDGINWASTATLEKVGSVSYSADKGFVAIGSSNGIALDKLYTSVDGINWVEGNSAALSGQIYQAAVINGSAETLIHTYTGSYYSSTDQITWTGNTTAAIQPNGMIDFYYKKGSVIFAAAKTSPSYDSGNGIVGTRLYRSADGGVNWTLISGAVHGRLISIIHDGMRYIAAGDEGMSYSTDGISWISALAYSNKFGANGERTASAKLGATTYYFGKGTTVLTSTDGVDFQIDSLDAPGGLVGDFTQAVVYDAGGVMVAITSGGSIIRYDGTTWSQPVASVSSIALNDIVWTGAQFVAVGKIGTVLTSTDGTTWTSQASWLTSGVNDITDVLVVGADLYATDANGRVQKSTDDGVNWTLLKDFSTSSNVITELAYDGSALYGFGKNFATNQIIVTTSTDNGAIWQTNSALSAPSGHVYYDAANTRFVTASSESTDGGVNWTAVSNYPAIPSFSYINAQTKLSQTKYGEIKFTSGAPDTYMSGQAYSEDGLSWIIKTGQMTYPGYTPASGNYAKVNGYDGIENGTGPGTIYVSTDGINFSPASIAGMIGDSNVNFIKYVNGQYIATANNYNGKVGVYTSLDGINWDLKTETVLDENVWAGQLTDIEYDGKQYLFMFDDLFDSGNVDPGQDYSQTINPAGTMIAKVSADFQTLNLIETGIRAHMTDLIVDAGGYTLIGTEGTIATHAAY